jgi:uroporphyrinogen decarboxylase
MDLDAIGVPDKNTAWRYEPLNESEKLYRDQWGAVVKFSSEAAGIPQEPAIKSEADFDKYALPDPDEDWRYERLKEAVKRFKGEKAIFCGCTDVFDVVKESFLGDVTMFVDMIRNPNFVKRISEKVLEYQLRYIKNCIEVGADFFFINGDYATTHAPMVSPKMAGEFLMPYLKSIADFVHQNGALLAKHSDGMLWPLFNQIVESGVNAVHPIDPEAGMDMGEAKAKYGHKVCLMGNVDCGPLLTWGTPDEVRHETKECIRKGGRGGGLICMSSNTIHSGVKPENYLAMVETIREYGTYPLEEHFDNLVKAGSDKWT